MTMLLRSAASLALRRSARYQEPAVAAASRHFRTPASVSSISSGEAKIRIVMKSFNDQTKNAKELMPNAQKIALPASRSLYTVLRSPHIDKKSREQFSMHTKKLFLVQKARAHELPKKFFWLKRMRVLGAQYEVQISFKTRLDLHKIGYREGAGRPLLPASTGQSQNKKPSHKRKVVKR